MPFEGAPEFMPEPSAVTQKLVAARILEAGDWIKREGKDIRIENILPNPPGGYMIVLEDGQQFPIDNLDEMLEVPNNE